MAEIRPSEIKEKLITARVGLLLRHSFFGNLATRMKLIPKNDIPTMATDFYNIYYNEEFVNSMTNSETMFVIAHEILHCAFQHFLRRNGRIPFLWNVAGDYIINYILVRDKVGDMPKMGLYVGTKYKEMSTEQVYDDLFEQGEEAVRQLGQLLDEHLDMSEDGDKSDQLADAIKEAIIQAASAGCKSTPTEIQRLIKEFTEPKITWKELIQQQIQSVVVSDYTWVKPSRRSHCCDAILPGTLKENSVDLCVAIDTSGSIGEEQLRDFLSEIKGITEEFKEFTIKLWSFDTSVHAYAEYNTGNVDELLDYIPGGGGGTCIDCNWVFMQENDIEPKRFIIFTDAYDGNGNAYENYESYCDTVWIIHQNPGFIPKFGVYCHYDEVA